jgi:hypothetical protein
MKDWTKEPPVVEGFYWYCDPGEYSAYNNSVLIHVMIVRFFGKPELGAASIDTLGDGAIAHLDDLDGYWYGPVEIESPRGAPVTHVTLPT